MLTLITKCIFYYRYAMYEYSLCKVHVHVYITYPELFQISDQQTEADSKPAGSCSEEANADHCVAIPSLSPSSLSPVSSPTERKVSAESPSGKIDKEYFLSLIRNDACRSGYQEFMEYTNRPEKFSMCAF